MRIIAISIDPSVFETSSAFAQRVRGYIGHLERYAVVVPTQKSQVVIFADSIVAYGCGGFFKFTRLINLTWTTIQLIRKHHFQIITVQDASYLALAGWCIARMSGLKLEVQIHGFENETWFRMIVARFVIKRADGVRVVSKRLKKMLMDDFGLDENRINVASVYTPLQIIPRDYSLWPHQPFIFLTVSRLVSIKNIRLQIQAIAVLKQDGFTCQLWIVGDGPDRNDLIAFSQQCGVSGDIRFLGYQSDVQKYYEQADAFLLTSNAEGWGLVILEAAAAGLPIIMTDVGCAGEIIIDNQSGVIIPVADQQTLVVMMKKIMTDKDLAVQLGRGAQQAVMNQGSYQDKVALYVGFWKKLL